MYTHTGEKPFKCQVCDKAYIRKGDLVTHMRVHTGGEKPFPCSNSSCDKTYLRKADLTIHMRTHTGEKPFKCLQCDRTFIRSSALKTHILYVHGGERPFKCSSCDKAFVRKTTLQTHMRTHTGEKPFECLVCRTFFATKGNRTRHFRLTHTKKKRIFLGGPHTPHAHTNLIITEGGVVFFCVSQNRIEW